MQNRTMLSFHKDRECPSSQELLDFQLGKARGAKNRKIAEHASTCDFCGAEAEFYSHFPNSVEDGASVAQIPTHLFELAEALLNNRSKGNSFLNKLLKENENFVI